MSQATELVALAQTIWTFGHTPNRDAFACPREAPDQQRPLADIRPDLAAMYAAGNEGQVPNANALGDAMQVLEGIARRGEPTEATERLAGLLGAGQPSKAAELIRLAEQHYEFGVTTRGEAYAVPREGPGFARRLRGRRRSLQSELARRYYDEMNTAVTSSALADAMLVIEARAQDADPVEPALRVGQDAVTGDLVLDLAREDGLVVIIRPGEWGVDNRPPVLFWRTNATLPLPVPVRAGSLDVLRDQANIAAADWPVVVACLVAALFPHMPHTVLLLSGEHGTAKTTLAKRLTSLVDPCACQVRMAPTNGEDWAVACAASWATCIDNISHLPPWLQDAICRASTGDGLVRRELYTDSDVSVLAFRRWMLLTAIDPGALQSDLADRLVSVQAQPIGQRREEKELDRLWEQAHARVLGGLLDLAAAVLAALPHVTHEGLPRMADFGRILLAVDEVLGTKGYARYTAQAVETSRQVAEGDVVCVEIQKKITKEWTGSASELLEKLDPPPGVRPPKDWPRTPQGMGGRLTKLAPTLRKLGWEVDFNRDGKKREWTLTPP